jgi:hypothetical protein
LEILEKYFFRADIQQSISSFGSIDSNPPPVIWMPKFGGRSIRIPWLL